MMSSPGATTLRRVAGEQNTIVGDLTGTADGRVFFTATGGGQVYGSVILEGEAKMGGTPQIIYNKDLVASLNVCTKCSHHFRLTATERLKTLFDGEWQEYDHGLTSVDPLHFTDTKAYRKRLEASIAATGLQDAVITATGTIDGMRCSVAAMEYGFIGGSMGVVVGEKITRAIERAIVDRIPVIIVSCSGGARSSPRSSPAP